MLHRAEALSHYKNLREGITLSSLKLGAKTKIVLGGRAKKRFLTGENARGLWGAAGTPPLHERDAFYVHITL